MNEAIRNTFKTFIITCWSLCPVQKPMEQMSKSRSWYRTACKLGWGWMPSLHFPLPVTQVYQLHTWRSRLLQKCHLGVASSLLWNSPTSPRWHLQELGHSLSENIKEKITVLIICIYLLLSITGLQFISWLLYKMLPIIEHK